MWGNNFDNCLGPNAGFSRSSWNIVNWGYSRCLWLCLICLTLSRRTGRMRVSGSGRPPARRPRAGGLVFTYVYIYIYYREREREIKLCLCKHTSISLLGVSLVCDCWCALFASFVCLFCFSCCFPPPVWVSNLSGHVVVLPNLGYYRRREATLSDNPTMVSDVDINLGNFMCLFPLGDRLFACLCPMRPCFALCLGCVAPPPPFFMFINVCV